MLVFYNIEDKKDEQIVVEIHDHLLKKEEFQKAELFKEMANVPKRKRYELLDWVKSSEEIRFQSSSNKCIYCDEDLPQNKGMFCTNHCEELEAFENTEKRA